MHTRRPRRLVAAALAALVATALPAAAGAAQVDVSGDVLAVVGGTE